MWSSDPYELHGCYMPDGSPMAVSGATASVCRALDAFDPVGPDERNTMTDGQTRRECAAWLGDFRWCDGLGRAVVRGNRDMYRLVGPDEVQRSCEQFLNARVVWARDAARRYADDDARSAASEAYLKWARRQDTAANAERLAKAMRWQRTVPPSELDSDPCLIGTPSGCMDLATGELAADRDEQLYQAGITEEVEYTCLRANVTKSVRAEPAQLNGPDWEPDPRWAEFVLEICDGDVPKAEFLRRALGYSLHGGNPEKATFVLWGPGRNNGKSTLMGVVKHVLGDYADDAPAGLLLVNRNESYTQANPVLAKLVGRRLVDVSEPPMGAELNGAMVKKLASGTDAVSTRRPYGDEFSYVPQFCVWMHCNSLPHVRDLTAIDPNHMHVVEFTRSFTGPQRDMGLTERFRTPLGMHTVLSWLVEGYRDYLAQGLNPPACVRAATAGWIRTAGTSLDRFVSRACTLGTGMSCDVADLKAALAAFCEAEGSEPVGIQAVNRYLRDLNVASRPSHGRRVYRGIALRPEALAALPAPPEDPEGGCVLPDSGVGENVPKCTRGATVRIIG